MVNSKQAILYLGVVKYFLELQKIKNLSVVLRVDFYWEENTILKDHYNSNTILKCICGEKNIQKLKIVNINLYSWL